LKQSSSRSCSHVKHVVANCNADTWANAG
jgi:hypothetical protein